MEPEQRHEGRDQGEMTNVADPNLLLEPARSKQPGTWLEEFESRLD